MKHFLPLLIILSSLAVNGQNNSNFNFYGCCGSIGASVNAINGSDTLKLLQGTSSSRVVYPTPFGMGPTGYNILGLPMDSTGITVLQSIFSLPTVPQAAAGATLLDLSIDSLYHVVARTGNGPAGTQYWRTTGNTGTVSSTNFVGTTDAQPLVFKANSVAAVSEMILRLDGGIDLGQSNQQNVLIGATAGTGIIDNGGQQNTAVGYNSMHNTTSGNQNTAIGWQALSFVDIGVLNSALGYKADVSDAGSINRTAIGANAYAGADNVVILGSINGVNGATANASVGIGTTAPIASLEVAGTFYQHYSSGGTEAIISSDNGGVLNFATNSTDTASITTQPNGRIVMVANDRIVMAVDAGIVGIGTSSPAAKLDIETNDSSLVSFATQYNQDAGTYNQQLYTLGNQLHASGDNATTTQSYALTADGTLGTWTFGCTQGFIMQSGVSDGNVGIGTNSPSSKLTVDETTGNRVFRAKANGNDFFSIGSGSDPEIQFGDIGGIFNGGIVSFDDANGLAEIDKYPVIALGTTVGDVGIGTASPDAKLHVVGTFKYVDGNQAAGKVLTSDVDGNATWQPPTLLVVTDTFFTSQTATKNLIVYTSGGTDLTYQVGGVLNVTAVTLDVLQFQVAYTDETNTPTTMALLSGISATGHALIPTTNIRSKAGTTITVSATLTTGTGSISYNAGATLTQY